MAVVQSPPPTARAALLRQLARSGVAILFALGVTAVFAWFLFGFLPGERARVVSDQAQRLVARADVRSIAVDQWLKDGLQDAATIATYPSVMALLGDGVARRTAEWGTTAGLQAHVDTVLTAYARTQDYELCMVADARGQVRAGSGGARVAEPGDLEAIPKVLADGRPQIGFTRHVDGEAEVTFAVPILGRASPGRLLGVGVIHASADRWLYPFLLATRGAQGSSEALLVRRDGDSILFLSPLRFEAGAPGTLRRPADLPDLAARLALAGGNRFGLFRDYRGRPVFAAVRRLEAAPWGLVVKVDRDEVMADFRKRSSVLIFAAGLAQVGVIALFALLWRRDAHVQAVVATRRLNLELEQRVRERTAELEQANAELDGFTRSVSHDLRAPLRAIEGFSRILQDEHAAQLDAEGARLLGVVRDGTLAMSRLIDDLLAFSRAGRHELRLARVDMRSLANAVFQELVPEAERGTVDFRLAAIPDAQGDAALLRQVWANLIGNALKFTGPRERRVIEVGSREEPGRVVYFVRDNGVGFDMAYVDRVFEVFQRLHPAEEFAGTGVGLALVQRIVQRHGGAVRAEGEVDRGATISFALPRPGGR
jgi:signal transduction histidine kinase